MAKDINVFGVNPKQIQPQNKQFFSQADIHSLPDGSVPQRVLEGLVVFTGLAADRPNGSTHIKCYFSTDTGVLSIWDGTAWKTTTLT